jgi:tellurite resistance protein TerC
MGTPTKHIGSDLEWAAFVALVIGLLALDLWVSRRREARTSLREALLWSAAWTALAAGFNLWILLHWDRRIAAEFLAAYLVERSLSFDNLLVFLVLFELFAVPRGQQRRVLHWGILGALLGRGLFVALGIALLRRWQWLPPLLGLLLAATGARAVWRRGAPAEPQRHPVLKLVRRFVPVAQGYRGRHFVVREGGRILATPLLLVLGVVEAADIAFAADSLPAVFGISRHTFIIFSSNIFAVLGLRSLYPVMAEAMRRLRSPHRLQVGLGLVLIWVGGKMAVEPWYAIPVEAVLLGVVLLLVPAATASLRGPVRPAPRNAAEERIAGRMRGAISTWRPDDRSAPATDGPAARLPGSLRAGPGAATTPGDAGDGGAVGRPRREDGTGDG